MLKHSIPSLMFNNSCSRWYPCHFRLSIHFGSNIIIPSCNCSYVTLDDFWKNRSFYNIILSVSKVRNWKELQQILTRAERAATLYDFLTLEFNTLE